MLRIGFAILFFIVLFPSCRSRRDFTSSKLDEELIRRIEIFIQQRDSIVSSRKEIHNFNEYTEIIERKFDITSKPDSAGNYPVISETITHIDKKGDIVVDESKEQISNNDIEAVEDQKQDKKQEIIVDNEVKANESFKYLVVLCILVVVTIILVFLKQVGIFRKSC